MQPRWTRGRGRSGRGRDAPSLKSCFLTRSRPTLRPHGLQPARLLYPWDFPGQNTGVGCQSLPQGIFPTQGWNLPLLTAGGISAAGATGNAGFQIHLLRLGAGNTAIPQAAPSGCGEKPQQAAPEGCVCPTRRLRTVS